MHNGERFIRQALISLLSQDFEDFELLVSDNASTDATQEICLELAARDERLRYHRNAVNLGPTANFNRVFELSSGKYFMWAAHDDYWDPEYVRSCIKALGESDAIVLAGTMGKLVDRETGAHILTDSGLRTVGMSPGERFRHYKSTIHNRQHMGVVFYGVYRRSQLASVMPLKNVIAHDHLLLARLCFLGAFTTVPKSLMVKRRGGTSTSYQRIAQGLGIQNPVLIKCPMLVRELFLQSIILQADQLTVREKVELSLWSVEHYVQVCGVPVVRRALRKLPVLVRRSVGPCVRTVRRICRMGRENQRLS